MFVVIRQDQVPTSVAAGEYSILYITMLCIGLITAYVFGKAKAAAAPFICLNIGAIIGFACLYSGANDDVKMIAAVNGTNTTIYSEVVMANCATQVACMCVEKCSPGGTCDGTPCFVNYTPVQGVRECITTFVQCYNQTVISSLSTRSGTVYLYENSTYTYPAAPPTPPQYHWQMFYPWNPQLLISQQAIMLNRLVGLSLMSIFYTITLICIAFAPKHSGEVTVRHNILPPPPYTMYKETPPLYEV